MTRSKFHGLPSNPKLTLPHSYEGESLNYYSMHTGGFYTSTALSCKQGAICLREEGDRASIYGARGWLTHMALVGPLPFRTRGAFELEP